MAPENINYDNHTRLCLTSRIVNKLIRDLSRKAPQTQRFFCHRKAQLIIARKNTPMPPGAPLQKLSVGALVKAKELMSKPTNLNPFLPLANHVHWKGTITSSSFSFTLLSFFSSSQILQWRRAILTAQTTTSSSNPVPSPSLPRSSTCETLNAENENLRC